VNPPDQSIGLRASTMTNKSDRSDGDGLRFHACDTCRTHHSCNKTRQCLFTRATPSPIQNARPMADFATGRVSEFAAPPKPAPDAVREALEPFAKAAEAFDSWPRDMKHPNSANICTFIPYRGTIADGATINYGHCREARAALAAPVPSPDGAGERTLEITRLEYEGWAQASIVSGYWIKDQPDNVFVQVCNGDLRKLNEATHEIATSPSPAVAAEPKDKP
jgi:hypothetical protein